MDQLPELLVSSSRLRALRSAMGNSDRPILLAIHDYPDPDAIASALAFQTLAGSWGIHAVIVHGGGIGREENAEMVRLLSIELHALGTIPDFLEYRGAVFLDTQPEARNQSVPYEVPVLAVIDHHNLNDDDIPAITKTGPSGTTRVVYTDIRTTIGASSTLAYGYLETAGIVPDTRLATALFLGIKTDTDGLLRNANPADISAYVGLLPLADMGLAAGVIHPPVERSQVKFLHHAMDKAVIHGSTLIVNCDEVQSPDILSTASDALINVKGLRYALAVGHHDGRIFLSLRAKPPHADATMVLLHVVEPEGRGGGHGLSAGGSTELGLPWSESLEVLRARLLEATGDLGKAGEPLIND